MSYQVLARKWRPHTFEDLVGQEHVVQALVNGLDQDRVHHAFLLTGTRGVGKTTIARILAKCLNCEQGVSSTPCGECGSCIDVDEGRFVDMLEIDAASKTKVDDTRELLETVQYTPSRGRYKVYIIDEVHMLSGHSFNALLKTLEEPPPHVKFILATTDPQKLPITILSRCLRFSLTRLLPDQISSHLDKILQTESIDAEASAVMRIARAADGSMRDGLSLLDQAIAFGGGSLKDSDVASMLGSIDHVHIAAIIDALSSADAGGLMKIVNDLVSQSRNLDSVLDELAEAMHRISLIHAAPAFRDPERADWDALVERAQLISPEDAQLYYQIAINGRRDLGLAPDPRTGLEMTLLRMLAFRPAEPGTGSAPAPVAKSAAAQDTGQPADEPEASAQATNRGLSSGRSEAVKAARAAFDQLHNAGDVGSPATPAAELPLEPDTASEQAGDKAAQDWASLQASLDLSGVTREFARNLQLEKRDEKRWRFLVPDALEQLGSQSVIRSLQSALSTHLGHEVTLDLHTEARPLESVAAVTERAELSRMSEAERAIDDDTTVKEIKEKFGAKIVPDSIQPLQ
ncbi:MAG: DNA polymerase III subunit gamma/tau [Gammaproteobacteria bacterium]|nr:DNA polymerase III subunit gamma/tau [Gammaproteobacteria bacterium]